MEQGKQLKSIEILRGLDFLSGYAIYHSSPKKVYRIGFFASKDSAKKISNQIKKDLKYTADLTVVSIPSAEKNRLNQWLKTKNVIVEGSGNAKNKKKLELLMERARLAMVKNDYPRAIANYTKVITYEDENFSRNALEYLGLARERNQQYAHAKAEYLRYLERYPDSEGAERVRQRLVGLMTAAMAPKSKLRKVKRRKRQTGWTNYGGITQYYRRDMTLNDESDDSVLSSNAYSSFFYTAKRKSRSYELNNRLSISHNMDFKDSDDNKSVRISTLYTQAFYKKLKTAVRIGRQTQNSSGAYGRFDGADLAYHYNPKITGRLTAGFPVAFDAYDTVETSKRFFSVNMEVESLLNYIDLNSYFITQYEKEVIDRSAIGFELRHFSRRVTFYSIMDYDISYQVLNNVLGNIRYQLLPRTTLGVNLNYRRSPLVTTTNALQGQQVATLADLLLTKTEAEIRQLARDRTAQYASATASLTQKLTKKLQLSVDYTRSRLSSTKSSDGVTGTQGTGYEDFISTQLIASDWIRKNDVTITSFRYAAMSTGKRYTVYALRQDPLPKKLLLNSRFRLDYQERSDGSTISSIRPSLKLNYKLKRRTKLEVELGLDHRIRKHSFDAGNETNGFVGLGYVLQLQ